MRNEQTTREGHAHFVRIEMEDVSKPDGTVTSNCVELVGTETVSVSGSKGFRFQPSLLPTVNPDKGLAVTFWLKVARFTAGWNILFHCGPDPHRTPATWFHGNSTRVHVRVSTTSNTNEGSDSSSNVFQINTWHHGAYVLEGNDLSFYVDGKKVVAYLLVGKPVYSDGTYPFFIGHDTKYNACHGHFKHVRFYNFALSRLEVKKDMHSVEPVYEAEGTLEGNVLSAYESLVDDPSHSDVTFRVGSANIHGHRCILSARSPYFQQLLGGSMKEASLSEIIIEGVSADTFLALLRYLYVGKVPSDPEEALKLMVAADYFSIERKLADRCRDTLATKLTVNNACQLLRVADRFGQESLKDVIMSFMSRDDNFTSLVAGDELYMLPRPLLRKFLTFTRGRE